MNHVYKAHKYFTNGQKIISVIKDLEGFEIGLHKNLESFSGYFYSSPMFWQFSLQDLKTKKYEIFEKVESEIVKILSKIETVRIPISHDSSRYFLEIRKIYPSTYHFTLNGELTVKKEEYKGKWIDKITNEVIKKYDSLTIMCCLNCEYFGFSGMSHDMSGGRKGYCHLVREKLEIKSVVESTTEIWNWCSKFEKK